MEKRVGLSRLARQNQIQALAFAAGTLGLAHSALAQCDVEVHKLEQARDVEKQKIDVIAKATQGKPIDPGVFCVVSAGFLNAELAIISYMEKNKDWCSFSEEAIINLKARHAKNADFNAKSCSVATTIEKMKEQGAPVMSGGPRTVIPLVPDRGTFTVPVTINDRITLNFVVDSGASDVSVPADVVMTLVRTGTIGEDDFLGKQTYQLADGSTVPSQRFIIRSLKVGDRTLKNVVGGIAPVTGSLLLGQSFLSRFKSVSIDYRLRALILY